MKTIESPRRIRPCLEGSGGPEIMTPYEQARRRLLAHPLTWLITGVAGFIGSNLAESLLKLNQRIVGLDNFATGKRMNLEQIRDAVQRKQWAQFTFIEGDIRAVNQVYNVAVNARTSLNRLLLLLHESLKPFYPHLQSFKPTYRSFRPGDVRDSEADIGKAARLLGYEPAYTVQTELNTALEWYRQNL
jgi:nucleoside-diphosphate-sugar epimerase